MLDNTVVVTFSGSEIHRNYQKEFSSLYADKFNGIVEYTAEDVQNTQFYLNNQQVFQYKKYSGYFLWKPFIIQETLKLTDKYVLYCDSNLRFTNFRAFEQIYNVLMEQQNSFFVKHDNFTNKEWTKADCFILMDANTQRFHNARQVWTPLMGFGHGMRIQKLLETYMYFCRNPQAVTEEPNTLGENLPGFREHRWEQSIMSILVELYSYNGIPDSQIMKWVTKEYSTELIKQKAVENEDPLAKSI